MEGSCHQNKVITERRGRSEENPKREREAEGQSGDTYCGSARLSDRSESSERAADVVGTFYLKEQGIC